MNIRKDIERYLIETAQVTQTRRYMWLCAIYVIVWFASAFHVFDPEYWKMRSVRKHIENISPQWNAFKHTHPGFESVELHPWNDLAYGVRFSAKGRIPLGASVNQLSEFMSSTMPPAPVDISRVTIDHSQILPSLKRQFILIDGRRVEGFVTADLPAGSITGTSLPVDSNPPRRLETNSNFRVGGSGR